MITPKAEAVERLEKLLDLALATLKGGDEEGALLILQEANVSAEKLPKKERR